MVVFCNCVLSVKHEVRWCFEFALASLTPLPSAQGIL